VSKDARSDEPDPIPARKVGGMAGMIAALTALVLISIVAFWAIGTQKTAGARTAQPSHIVVATEAPRPSQD
jgi:hypothetical protein